MPFLIIFVFEASNYKGFVFESDEHFTPKRTARVRLQSKYRHCYIIKKILLLSCSIIYRTVSCIVLKLKVKGAMKKDIWIYVHPKDTWISVHHMPVAEMIMKMLGI